MAFINIIFLIFVAVCDLFVLFVSDVPNPPNLQSVSCNKHDASIHWQPMGDNRAPILRYTIQFNTSFTPDTWEVAYDEVPATEMTYTVSGVKFSCFKVLF